MTEVLMAICALLIILFTWLNEQDNTPLRDFQCTDSNVVDGIAECVKYEKKVEK